MNQNELKEKITRYKNYIFDHKKNIKRVENALELLYNDCEHDETRENYAVFETEYDGFECETEIICLICGRIVKKENGS